MVGGVVKKGVTGAEMLGDGVQQAVGGVAEEDAAIAGTQEHDAVTAIAYADGGGVVEDEEGAVLEER